MMPELLQEKTDQAAAQGGFGDIIMEIMNTLGYLLVMGFDVVICLGALIFDKRTNNFMGCMNDFKNDFAC